MKRKVSLITPCYNGEQFIQLYISNIIRQDYPYVEVIFVNDGSTYDMTLIVQEIEGVVKNKGYEFVYLYKKNGGAASAVNLALKYVTGDYIMLLDMDDEIFERAISAKAEYLNNHPEIDAVISNGYYKFEDNRRKPCQFIKASGVYVEKIFEKLLMMNFYNWPGSYMVRCNRFFEINGGKEIYQSCYGQNMQILLPATYHKKVYFLDEHLMNYYIRNQSVSHTDDNNRVKELLEGYQIIRENVVRKICNTEQERKYYLYLIRIASVRKKMHYACRKKNKQELEIQYTKLKELEAVRFSDKLTYICGQNFFLIQIYKIVNYIVERITSKVI